MKNLTLVESATKELDGNDLTTYVRHLEAQLDTAATDRFVTIVSNRITALRTEISRADLKAQVFLALAAPATGLTIISGTLTGLDPAAAIAGWIAVAFAAAAIVAFALTLWPRLSKRHGLGSLGITPTCATITAHVRALRIEHTETAAIATSKYRHIRWGMSLLAAASAHAVVALALTPLP